MIVTSIRCFLNIITQLWTADKLLTANYYIADCASGSRSVNLTDSVRYNEFGQLVTDPSIVNNAVTAIGRYRIKYDMSCLNPEPFRAECLVGVNDDYSSSYEKFIKHLNNPETMLDVYRFLFKDPLQENSIQVLIFYDDQNLLDYGHIVCQYLSQNFGTDIIFIDPAYRPNCRGYCEYHGDKMMGAKTEKDLRDFDLLYNFSQSISCSDIYNNISNVTTFLSQFDFNDIIYLYNLLFPDDPLPPGNYSIDHIKQIIIGRATDGIRTTSPLPNITCFDWRSVIDRYERESADEAIDDGEFSFEP